jgi:starvation-inducible DNA-binding protein
MLADKKTIKPKIGLCNENLNGLNEILSRALGTAVTLSYKVKKYHWNVTGPNFQQLHELFDEQYSQFQVIVDDLAEYIRQYGQMSPGTLTEFKELSIINEHPGNNPAALDMVSNLVSDYEEFVKFLREEASIAIDKYNDPQVEDLFVGFIHQIQKMAWFLRAHLENNRQNN